MKNTESQDGSASDMIDMRIAELDDWRGDMLARLRALIHEADPEVVEEWKWMGTPVFSHGEIITTGESYKSIVKLTFAKGAFLADPSKLFNSSLEGNMRRAIDFHDGAKIDEPALKALIRAAVELNTSGQKAPAKKTAAPKAARKATPKASKAKASKPKAKAKPAKSKPAKRARK